MNKEVDVMVRVTPASPPNEVHRQFLREIVERWPEIYKRLRETLFEDMGDLKNGTTMEQVFDSLDFEAFLLRDAEGRPRHWEIGATTPQDDHLFGIMMEEFDHQGFRMDG